MSIPTTGLLAGTVGWESVFYVHGGLAVIWLFLWAILISDSPEMNRFISVEEKNFISEHHSHGSSPPDQKVSKGQLISRCPFGVFKLNQKPTKCL